MKDSDSEHRGFRFVVAASALAMLALGLGAAVLLPGGSDDNRNLAASSSPGPAQAAGALLDDGRFTIATAKGGDINVYSRPIASASLVTTLRSATEYGSPTTLLVDREQHAPSGWLPVTVPLQKPNNTRGWIQSADVTTRHTSYSIRVSLTDHSLVLLKDGRQLLETKVIIGTSNTKTPVGRFYVTDPLNCNTELVAAYRVVQCDAAYGTFAIGVSALSESLESFAGTIPQIAIHGMSLPNSELGKDLSNGCVRIPNDVIVQLAQITPLLGTPVTITA